MASAALWITSLDPKSLSDYFVNYLMESNALRRKSDKIYGLFS